MDNAVQASRPRILRLLEQTRSETRRFLAGLDPERVVHTDERAWRVRDVIGHLGVWNLEAARSLRAFAAGKEYHCIEAEGEYYDYNGPAADERRRWTMEQVWAEYDEAHAQLRQLVESLPDEKWNGTMLYPWNAHGTPPQLIEIMMTHERVDHCAVVRNAVGS